MKKVFILFIPFVVVWTLLCIVSGVIFPIDGDEWYTFAGGACAALTARLAQDLVEIWVKW